MAAASRAPALQARAHMLDHLAAVPPSHLAALRTAGAAAAASLRYDLGPELASGGHISGGDPSGGDLSGGEVSQGDLPGAELFRAPPDAFDVLLHGLARLNACLDSGGSDCYNSL